ncbi:hypothetical protein [Bremerella sp. P1]|uniref:hypothetical protein n=1 Tax=Bremerella sp. P1 TaxID=3026424 RepID=UPI002367614A|nr:hypothetical protein [Bremerella sp. P1]WDI41362.1 hypothetical protein PSR63_23110 [Bremerella sp. P1]
MSTNHAQPDQRGTRSTERKPQVVVRAGKTFLCSSCGTLVEVPADVVGQLVVAVDSSPQEAPAEPSVADEQPPQVEPDPTVTPAKSSSCKDSPRPSHAPKHRPQRPSAPKKSHLIGEMIDGLKVPSAKQLDRALAWVSFHLKVLDRQGTEKNRLRKLLKKQKQRLVLRTTDIHETRPRCAKKRAESNAPAARARGLTKTSPTQSRRGRVGDVKQIQACANTGMTSRGKRRRASAENTRRVMSRRAQSGRARSSTGRGPPG